MTKKRSIQVIELHFSLILKPSSKSLSNIVINELHENYKRNSSSILIPVALSYFTDYYYNNTIVLVNHEKWRSHFVPVVLTLLLRRKEVSKTIELYFSLILKPSSKSLSNIVINIELHANYKKNSLSISIPVALSYVVYSNKFTTNSSRT